MLVLFDIDDTLLDDRRAMRVAAAALHVRLESSMPLPAFCARWRDSSKRHFARYLAGAISFQEQRRTRVRDVFSSDLSDSAADDIFAEYLLEYENAWSLFPDVRPCFESLREHRLGVVSNGNAAQQREKLSRLGLSGLLACVVLSEDCGCAKPDPRIFLRACDLTDASPADAVYVGDRFDVDVVGASRAGIRPVWLNRRGVQSPSPGEAVSTIETLADLHAVLSSLPRGAG